MAQPGDGGALDAMAQPGASDGRCDYERQRDANIARNEAYLASLGLGGPSSAAAAAPRKRPRAMVTPRGKQEATRKSSRQQGAAPEAADGEAFAAVTPAPVPVLRVSRPSNAPRLTAAQAALLDAAHGEAPRLLDDAERAAAEAVLATFEAWSTEDRVRAALSAAGARAPAWLALMEKSAVLVGKSAQNRSKVMVVLEKMAAGVGAASNSWPRGTALCGGGNEPLTLGTDVEVLKHAGKCHDARHGADVSRGWAWAHALGKLKLYQQLVLERMGASSTFDGPSLADLAADGQLQAFLPEGDAAAPEAVPAPEAAPAAGEGGAAAPEAAPAPEEGDAAAPEAAPAAGEQTLGEPDDGEAVQLVECAQPLEDSAQSLVAAAPALVATAPAPAEEPTPTAPAAVEEPTRPCSAADSKPAEAATIMQTAEAEPVVPSAEPVAPSAKQVAPSAEPVAPSPAPGHRRPRDESERVEDGARKPKKQVTLMSFWGK
ncbi:hypothetical protein M885DRAFT_516513 [Pelagophyceae sp. CCMP2097]|nr:hypothetical protein M885DRAFT_516513 [Pelagophyceae sp. CCMP2097]